MLRPEQVKHFLDRGYVVVPGVVAMERVEELRAAHEQLLATWARECDVPRAEYERVVSQWTSLHEQHSAFARQIHHPTIEAIACHLLSATRVQLFHDHFISKPPGVSATIPWHQDYPFWPVSEPRALSCWLALDDIHTDSGGLRFMPGAHREGEQPPVDFLRAPKDWGTREQDAREVLVAAGDCVFHHCLSWHTSAPNLSQQPRRAFITIMMDAECRWDPEHSDWHPMNECVTVSPGAHFNTERFPIIGAIRQSQPC